VSDVEGSIARVESVAVIPTPDGTAEELWVIVQRWINGGLKRYVEVVTELWMQDFTHTDAWFSDSALQYNGVPADNISGLGHLEGETVSLLADGKVHPDVVVTGGAITLNFEASIVTIGLPFAANMQTLRPDIGSQAGTAQGKVKRIDEVVFRFDNTLGLQVGPDEDSLDEITFTTAGDPMDQPPPLFTGDKPQEWDADYGEDALIYVRSAQPYPATLLAVIPRLETNDA
jgi:hypothetical protein